MTFEKQIEKQVKETILKQINDCRFVEYHYSNKKRVPTDIVEKAWEKINWEEVTEYVTKQLQEQVCKTIVGNMITETKTDVKDILSVEGVRKKLRMKAYPKVMEVLNEL
ncbi:MAG: hypothetical protein KGV59_06190 [Tenacibaculum sp.]|nr:hypothetical protein [Tenacibaculum sp.]